MLHGIGGCTIAQAKENLSYKEAVAWSKYIRQNGSLNVGQRIEHSVALLATALLRSQGNECEIYDFLLHTKRPEPEAATLAGVFQLFNSVKKP